MTPPNTQCNTCLKIMDVLQVPFDEGSQIELGRAKELLTDACPHANWLRLTKSMLGNRIPLFEKRDLAVVKKKDRAGVMLAVKSKRKLMGDTWSSPNRRFELVSRPEIPQHQGTVRILDDRWADLGVIKDWIARCIELHGISCDKTVGNIPPFKPRLLIDVVQACVVVCKETSPRFITLSYTWGQTKNFRTTTSNIQHLSEPGALRSHNIFSQLPKTIVDAIELTRALGETWLWVDSLCIVQDDEESLAHELAQMHRIYATSFLTIIAADGEDANYGLRGLKGISSEREMNQTVFSLSGDEQIAWIGPDRRLRGSHGNNYFQRMWTSQEHDFAKRRLFFRAGMVRWECSSMAWDEYRLYNAEADTTRAVGMGRYIGSGTPLQVPSLDILSHLIVDFNSRTLRFGEDVFKAFSGYSTYLNGIFPSGLVYGHPQLFFDISLCWYSWVDIRRRAVSKEHKEQLTHKGLPSWSWMGWHGPIYFPYDSEGELSIGSGLGYTDAVTEWYVMEDPGSTERQLIKSTWSQYRKAPHESMPDTWRCTKYEPPATLKRLRYYNSQYSISIAPEFMPKELPSYIYTYISAHNGKPISRWYPVPVNEPNSESGSEPGLGSRYQYLWCQTSRAYLCLGLYGLLKDIDGNTVGVLDHYKEGDDESDQGETKVELISIVRGWSTSLRRIKGKGQDYVGPYFEEIEPLTDQDEEEASQEQSRRHKDIEDPWIDEWERYKEDKQDCYHVLYIEWENGIAYRRGCGCVLADHWERLAEPGKVDITLG